MKVSDRVSLFFRVTSLLLFLPGFPLYVVSATWYVAPSGSDLNAGTAWTLPFETISNAVESASDGDTVLASNGIYDLTAEIVITKDVLVRSVNGVSYSFINGNYPATTNRCIYMEHTNAVLEGFTITNGNLTAAPSSGAGVYINGGTLRDCTVNGNSNQVNGALGGGVFVTNGCVLNCNILDNYIPRGYGGGIYVRDNSVVSNCTIRGNVAYRYGGGVAIRGGIVVDSVIDTNYLGNTWGGGVYMSGGLVSNCTISCNTAITAYGGGVYMINGTLCNSTIISNFSPSGAGGVEILGGLVENCSICTNYASSSVYNGGGVNFRLSDSVATVRGCVISNNYAYRGGGGVMLMNTNAVLENCCIVNNFARDQASGGGIRATAGVIRNCLIRGNHAAYTPTALGGVGGGMRIEAPTIIQNCTVVGNSAAGSATNTAGGINVVDCDTIQNTIVYFNTHDARSNYVNQADIACDSCCFAPELTGGSVGISANNITDDPKLVDLSQGDCRLGRRSPCINAGTNQAWMTGAVDLDGNARINIYDGIVDIGAYEFDTPPPGSVFLFR